MHDASKIFVKTYLKAIRDTFLPNMWNFPLCDIFIQQKGEFKLLDLQGNPPPPQFPHLVGYPDLPMRKILRVVGLLTVNDFLSKQKIYSL